MIISAIVSSLSEGILAHVIGYPPYPWEASLVSFKGPYHPNQIYPLATIKKGSSYFFQKAQGSAHLMNLNLNFMTFMGTFYLMNYDSNKLPTSSSKAASVCSPRQQGKRRHLLHFSSSLCLKKNTGT